MNFIPTGSSYGLVFRDSRGKLLELTSSEKNVDFYLKSLAEQTPWVVFGYDRKLEKLYKKERQGLRKPYPSAGQPLVPPKPEFYQYLGSGKLLASFTLRFRPRKVTMTGQAMPCQTNDLVKL